MGFTSNPLSLKANGEAKGKEYVEQKEGAYRVAGTQVLLDSVVYPFQSGASPESIQRSFSALTLEQVYGTITFYLSNRKEIDQYLIEGGKEFEKLREASREASREAHPQWYEKLERSRNEILDLAVRKTRFQADVNLNENIVTGILRRAPEIDFQTVHKAKLHGLTDSEVLTLATDETRILVTQDQRTMPKRFGDFMQTRNSPGVLIISQKSDIEPAIEELILIWKAFESEDHVESILYLDL